MVEIIAPLSKTELVRIENGTATVYDSKKNHFLLLPSDSLLNDPVKVSISGDMSIIVAIDGKEALNTHKMKKMEQLLRAKANTIKLLREKLLKRESCQTK